MEDTGAEGDPRGWPPGWPGAELDALCLAALREDVGPGDVTSAAVVPPERTARARLVAKAAGVLAGLPVAARVFGLVDAAVRWQALAREAGPVAPGQALAEVEGRARSLLAGERVALNFLCHLSGVATLTARFVARAGRTEVLDTRKTTPGLRWLEKYAVRAGGGRNHRFGLHDGLLIKDNHVRAAGGVAAAVRAARARGPFGLRVEVECGTLEEVEEAVEAGADIVLLDNMPPALLGRAVALVGGRARTEASGRVTLEGVAEVAATGVDMVSVGALTHSAPALDLSLEFV